MQLRNYLLLSLTALAVLSCGKRAENAEGNSEIYISTNDESTDGSRRVGSSKVENEVTWKSTKVHYVITREPDDSLPKVKDEDGDLYVDNRITLEIQRDGATFFNREFTKESFASVLDEKFMKNGVLEGMILYKTTESGLVFTASVSYPQSDLFVPIILTISANGSMEMTKDTSPEEFLGGKLEE